MESNFTTLDWGIVIVYLAATVGIGLYANRYIRNMADYIVAGRALGSHLSIATMLGSEIGLVTVMYTSQKGFSSGLAAFHIGVAGGLACLVVGLTGFIVVPLRRVGVMTIPEYYGRRFGKEVRIAGGIVLAGAGILNMGVFLKAGAIFITALTGINDPVAVNVVMTILIALVLFYTILGGMVSVVITDYIQFIVLSFGLLLTCWFAVADVGWNGVVEAVKTVHGEAGFDPLHGDGFGLSYVLYMVTIFGFGSCAVWPTAVMRACSAKSETVVRQLYVWSSIGFMMRIILPQFLGVCALAFLWQKLGAGSEFFTAEGKVVDNVDVTLKALPTFLAQILPVGIIGIIGAGMLAAFMSTHDSYLLCWASVIVEDVINPLWGGKLKTRQRLSLARVLIFAIGVFLLVWSLWYPMGEDMIDYMAVSGSIYMTGAFAILICGLYWKRASRLGALLALMAGLLSVFGLSGPLGWLNEFAHNYEIIGSEVEIEKAHVILTTLVLSMLMMVIGSLMAPDPKLREERKDGKLD